MGYNLDEYVTETIQVFHESGTKRPPRRDVATAIAEILCDQGHVEADTDAEFDALVYEIEEQLPYYGVR